MTYKYIQKRQNGIQVYTKKTPKNDIQAYTKKTK